MRIRVVKPDYWRDRLLAGMRADVREFYIGLWMQADDAGWLRWQPEEVAADLYPYRSVKVRERQVRRWFEELEGFGRVIFHPCGHAVIPTFTAHQKTVSARQTRVRDAHLFCGSQPNPDQSGSIRQEGKVKEGKGREGKPDESSDDPPVIPYHRRGRSA